MAKAATTARAGLPLPAQVQEATAALQDLACQFAGEKGEDDALSVVAELGTLQAHLPRELQVERNGPYLATNVSSANWTETQ